jgi:PDZ domain-containing secreted protein
VQTPLTLVQALEGWFDRDVRSCRANLVFDPSQSDEEIDEENTVAMASRRTSRSALPPATSA